MNEWYRTRIIPERGYQIQESDWILTVGSCFAEHIGTRLIENKWQGFSSPFGACYHPMAIEKLLRVAILAEPLDPEGFIVSDGYFYHYDLHSQFFGQSESQLQELWQQCLRNVRLCLKKRPVVLLTLGSSFFYEHRATGQFVGNCHKQDASLFVRRRSSVLEISECLKRIQELLAEACAIVCSVSPVRHLKETLIANSASKSCLRVAIDECIDLVPSRLHYFPAYELMIDDLRDYRFYQRDMLHPSEEALDYIWERFTSCYLDSQSLVWLRKWSSVLQALKHSPKRLEAPSYQKYLRELLGQLATITDKDISAEQSEILGRLKKE